MFVVCFESGEDLRGDVGVWVVHQEFVEVEELDDFAETVCLDALENQFVHDLGPEVVAVTQHVVESFFEDFEVCRVGGSGVIIRGGLGEKVLCLEVCYGFGWGMSVCGVWKVLQGDEIVEFMDVELDVFCVDISLVFFLHDVVVVSVGVEV